MSLEIRMRLKRVITSIAVFIVGFAIGQTDRAYQLKVHFLYGSKPKWKYRTTEYKAFGGLHGGHVTIELDGSDYGFVPAGSRVHIFPRKKPAADFVDNPLNGMYPYSAKNKTVTFVIPIDTSQYTELKQILGSYSNHTPFDYAFFGMRCASTTAEILGEIGIIKKRKRFANIVRTFYPKKLRKRLFKLARRENYEILQNEGVTTRKWERD